MRPKRLATRYYSDRQEKHIAKVTNGKQTANSGATDFFKGDVTIGNEWLLECKTVMTEKQSFSIKRAWLEKNEEERFAMGKDYSALCFDFGDNGKRYYVIDEPLFKRLVDLLKEENI